MDVEEGKEFMEMNNDCEPNDPEMRDLEQTVERMGINPYDIYISIMENIFDVNRGFRRTFRDLVIRYGRDDIIKLKSSLRYKLLGIELFLIIEPPGLVRQYAGHQTYLDVLSRYTSSICLVYDPINPYKVAWRRPLGENIVPERYIKYARFWIRKQNTIRTRKGAGTHHISDVSWNR